MAGSTRAETRWPVFVWDRKHAISLRSYLVLTRDLSVAGVYILPVVVLYELGVRLSHLSLRNSAEVMLKDLVALAGPLADFAHLLVLAASLAAAYDVVRRRLPFLTLYLPFLAECVVWALLLGPLVTAFVPALVLKVPFGPSLLLSIGAGLYEEIVFRFFVLASAYVLLKRCFAWRSAVAVIMAVLLSALLFAGYHYVGPYGEPFRSRTFCYRFVAGIILGVLFVFRGLGATVYLHAIYDLLRDFESS
ncbi:MAG: CPBP family intramembrane glutamic endopeptidase [Planctomycetota bacterium]